MGSVTVSGGGTLKFNRWIGSSTTARTNSVSNAKVGYVYSILLYAWAAGLDNQTNYTFNGLKVLSFNPGWTQMPSGQWISGATICGIATATSFSISINSSIALVSGQGQFSVSELKVD